MQALMAIRQMMGFVKRSTHSAVYVGTNPFIKTKSPRQRPGLFAT